MKIILLLETRFTLGLELNSEKVAEFKNYQIYGSTEISEFVSLPKGSAKKDHYLLVTSFL
jgi:hypothetical protein